VTGDLPVGLDDYRELALFLEQQIAEASVASPHEVGELQARLARLHEILAQAAVAGEQAEQALHDQFEADAFDLRMKRPRSKADILPLAPAPPAAERGPGLGLDDLEPLVAGDPGDDDLRQRYIELAESLSCQLRAADALRRVLDGETRPDARERVGFDLALLYLGEGELPAARGALLGAVTAGANGPAALKAARRLLNLQVDPSDPELIGPAREVIAKADPDPAARREAAEGILSLHATAPQKDARLAVAYRALVGTPRTAEALTWLRRFYAKSGNSAGFLEWLEHAEHWGELARVLEGDIDLAPAKDKSRLFAQLGELRLVRLGDANGAVAAFGRALALDAIGAADVALAALTRAHAALRDRDRHDLTLKIARALSRKDQGQRALGLCRALFAEPSLEPAAVQEIAEIAHDEDDTDLYRHALEHLSRDGDPDAQKKALERLGDFQFAQLGDRRAAAESWRPAARMYEAAPGEKEHAQVLYERVLEAIPDDRDAAGRLAALYAEAGDWARLPDVLRVLVRAGENEERTARLLLDLEKSAVAAGEVSEYASLVEVFVGAAAGAPPDSLLALKRARARVLGSDATHRADASAAYRDVIASSQSDGDVRAFEAFIESVPDAEERHRERRWLYERRVSHGPRPAEVLLEWAKAEEELGESESAIALYVRLAELAPTQREGLEAMCRLKLQTGDFEGGLAALRSLREVGTDEERRAIALQMARVLLEDLGRPAEAALALAPLLDVVPPLPAARQMMRRALADPAARQEVAESVERLAGGDDRAAARRVFQFLIDARDETASLAGARRRWFERLVDLSAPDARAVLSAATRGAVELPDAMTLWDHAERAAREVGQAELVVKAYRDALVDHVDDGALAETLARRMLDFANGFALPDSARVVEALQKLLVLVPGARWALDRVKLVLGSAARWDELFGLYDRAIEATADDKERADLLDEAARAAKDVAGQPERAIPYLEAIHNLRPDDVNVRASLERAYERQGHTRALIDLLTDGLEGTAGFKRRETLQRIASLWLDLGGVTEALEVVEKTLADGAATADVSGLLERIAAGPAPGAEGTPGPSGGALAKTLEKAVALLREHYEKLGQPEDVVRMASRQLALAEGAGARGRAIRDLKVLLSRATKLALPKPRRRELLRATALSCAERPGDRDHAIALLAELLEDDAADDVAARAVDAYAGLLEATGQAPRLARLWEEQARVHAAADRTAQRRACWERAAEVWRRQGSTAEAVAAYKQAASLDSEAAHEGLAAMHEQSGDWAAAASALEWLNARAPAAARGQRALRLAQAYVALDDRTSARARLEHALDAGVEAGRLDEVSDTLVGLYRRDEAWRPLAERLVANAGRTKDAEKKLALLTEAAELLRSRAGAPAEAAVLLEKAVLLRPADPTLRPALADVLEAVGRWDRVVEVLKDQVALHGTQRTKERALTHHRLARAMTRAGRPKDALAELRAAGEMLPAHPGVLFDLARAALEVGQLELAESTFRALLLALHHPSNDAAAPPPHRAEVFLDLSEIAVRKSDLARATDLVDSAVDAALETGERPERFEEVLASRGRHDLLARAIERRVERAPTLAARATALGALASAWATKLDRPQDLRSRIAQSAARIGRELEHEAATDVGAWAALAAVHDALGDEAARAATDQKLVSLLEAAIAKAGPGAARATLRVTFAKALLHTAGGADRAISALSTALDEDPESTEAAELLGAALVGAGRSDEARRALKRLLSKRPDDAFALEQLAALAAAGSDWDAAIEMYGKLFAQAQGAERLVHIASELADACEKAGRPDEARETLERALEAAPECAPLTQRLAQICEKRGDWARLARLAETLRAKHPDNFEAVLLWAQALRHLSRGAEALAGLTAAIERCQGKRSPLVARLLVEAARAHLAADELVEAFEQLKAAFAIDARSGDVAMLLGLVAIDLDDERTAERALFAITGAPAKSDPDRHAQATAFCHLAALALAKGDGGKARRLTGKALSIEPGHPEARSLLEGLDSSGSAVVARRSIAEPPRSAPERSAVTPRS
jgi:tetratricopeptide (TPR) repeat protein